MRGDRVVEWRVYEDTAEQRAALVLVTGAVHLTGFDHIVLCTADVERTLEFYRSVLSMEPRQERLGKLVAALRPAQDQRSGRARGA